MLSNEVVISIIVLLALSLLRINVVIALIIAALTCGVIGFYGVDDMSMFDALTKRSKIYQRFRRWCGNRDELRRTRRICRSLI
ncbi:permease [Actinobacillus pleuropneumoniae]|nr:permease [Actinobacillus pleuropneumoniae]